MAASAHALTITGTVRIRDLSQPIIIVNIIEPRRMMEESENIEFEYIV